MLNPIYMVAVVWVMNLKLASIPIDKAAPTLGTSELSMFEM